jgi:hypothetical protein
MGQVRGVQGVAEFFPQARVEPAMVAAVQGFDGTQVLGVDRGGAIAHGRSEFAIEKYSQC